MKSIIEKISKKINFLEIFHYSFFGFLSVCLNLFLFFVLKKLKMQYIVANSISYIITVIISYYLNKIFVFKEEKNKDNGIIKIIKFFIIKILYLVVDNVIFYTAVTILKFNIDISRILITLLGIPIVYVFSKRIVFNAKEG